MGYIMKRLIKYVFITAVIFFLATGCFQSEKNSENKINLDFLEDENEIDVSEFTNLPDIKDIIAPEEIVKADDDLSSINVNYFNPDDFDLSGFVSSQGEGGDFHVADFSPSGMLPNEMSKKPVISVVFSDPVVPLSRLGKILTESPVMKIDPPVQGKYRWYGSRTLSFEPDGKLLPQKEYTVSVSADTKSVTGASLREGLEFSFYTEYIDFTSVYPSTPDNSEYINIRDIPLPDARKITVQLSYPFDIDVIKDYIEVVTPKSPLNTVPFEISRSEYLQEDENLYERTAVLSFSEDFPEDTDIVVSLKKGAKSYEDSLGREEESSRNLHTIKPFRFRYSDNYSYSFPRSQKPDSNPVYLTFTHPVSPDAGRILEFIETTLDTVISEDNIEIFDNIVKINNLPVEYNSKYTVTVRKGLTDIYGRELTRNYFEEIEVPDAASYAYFRDSGFKTLEAQFDPKMIFEFQNLEDSYWNIGKVDDWTGYSYPYEYRTFDTSYMKKNRKYFRTVDLKDYLNDSGFGTVGLRWKMGVKRKKYGTEDYETRYRYNKLILQVSDLGATVRYGYDKAAVWVNSLSSGSPVADATVELIDGKRGLVASGVTDSSGLSVIEYEKDSFSPVRTKWDRNKPSYYKEGMVVKITKGDDTLYFQPGYGHNRYRWNIYGMNEPWSVTKPVQHAMLFTDRGLYKPGETVTFRGIVQKRSTGEWSPDKGTKCITVPELNNRSKNIYAGDFTLTEEGGFSGEFKIPENTPVGEYRIMFFNSSLENRKRYADRSIYFRVAEFKRAEFQVDISPSEMTYYAGDSISLEAEASFLSGGNMADAPYRSSWRRSSISYSPSGREFSNYVYGPDRSDYLRTLGSKRGKLSGSGNAELVQKTGSDHGEGLTYRYTAEISVQDLSNQELAAARSVTVHPAEFYIGAKIKSKSDSSWWSTFVSKGDPVLFDINSITPEEELYVKDVQVKAELVRKEWKSSTQRGVYGRMNYNWEMVESVEKTVTIDMKNGISGAEFLPENCGSYKLRLSSGDMKERAVITELDFYVTGGSWVNWGLRSPENIELIPDKDEYRPGETAKILVKTPLNDGKYLMTIEREGLLEEKLIDIKGSAGLLEIPVSESWVPVVYIALCSNSERKETPRSYYDEDIGKPRGYFGITPIRISTESKEFEVEIIPDKDIYKPGSESRVRVRVTRNGKPVKDAEVTFLAVDRGVLDLINYHIPDPVKYFYSPYRYPHAVLGGDSRSLLIDPVTYEVEDHIGGDSDKMQRRKEFSPLAVFKPFLKTDENGFADADFIFPDTLTTYRSTAFVVKSGNFGYREHELFVRNPVTVRAASPLELRVRDKTEVKAVLTNLTGKDVKILVTAESNILKISGKSKKAVLLKAGSSRAVPFDFTAVKTGDAVVQFLVQSDNFNEILEQKIKVTKPLVKETFTITGNTDAEGSPDEEMFIFPSTVNGGYGGINLALSSGMFPSSGNAVSYLDNSPWKISLRDNMYTSYPDMLFGEKLSELSPGNSFSASELSGFASLLKKHQFSDGGFINDYRYKDSYSRSDLYLSLEIAEYQSYARLLERSVLSEKRENALVAYLGNQMNDPDISVFSKCRIAFLLSRFGKDMREDAQRLLEKGDELGMSGYLYCGLSLYNSGDRRKAEEVLEYCRKFVKTGTRSVDFSETYEAKGYFDSPVRRLSLLCMLYHRIKGSDNILPVYASTLCRAEKNGYWNNRYDTLTVLLAAADYSMNEKSASADMSTEVKIGNETLFSGNFEGLSSSVVNEKFTLYEKPLNSLEKDTPYPLSFSAEGRGRLFYSASFSYALPSEIVSPRDEGISLFTEIRDLEGNSIESSSLKNGETYRMRFVISSSKTRYDLGVQIPVPSGCEILNSSFVTTGSYAESGGVDSRSWTDETEYGDTETYVDEGYIFIEDEGMRIYSLKPDKQVYNSRVFYRFPAFRKGSQTVDFLFRTVSAGTYPTPPAYAEVIDEPEVFGRSGGMLIEIVDEK